MAARDPFAHPVQYLKGVGPRRAELLARLGIASVGDLLYHLPRRYEDRRAHAGILVPERIGETVTAGGVVLGGQELRPRRGLIITKLALDGGNGVFYATWFNQPYILRQIRPGMRLFVVGRLKRAFGRYEINVLEHEAVENGADGLHSGRIVPVYPATENLAQKVIRQMVRTALDEWAPLLADLLPGPLRRAHRLLPIAEALAAIHFPSSWEEKEEARRSLAAEEMFLLQAALAIIRRGATQRTKPAPHGPDGPLVAALLADLPYRLTGAQQRVWREISGDMQQAVPMRRLLQGDVGSGKTVIAALALVKAVEGGFQGGLMAPTEILAEQHYLRLREMLDPLGIEVHLLTGGMRTAERRAALAAVAGGQAGVVVGTQALIQEGVGFARLGLAVIDEQHRFGVRQRARLQEKGLAADVLVMTATPIPRTLALTLYGDLDLSVIDEMPPGRKPVQTEVVRPRDIGRVWRHILAEAGEGRQAYVVCPLVEESENLQSQAAVDLERRLAAGPLRSLRVGLLHGRMRPAEKEAVMELFRRGEIQVLVSTSVIEVGVDVPRATTIVIYDAERFGLAQLHQLRGRVGRGGGLVGSCFLVSSARNPEARARLEAVCGTTDGFALAEFDLKLRGPGEFLGLRQSGQPLFRAAQLPRDLDLAARMRAAARWVVEHDPELADPVHAGLRTALELRFGEFLRGLGIS
ncbi:MAG: ATP-dependent DNA helicase RecG [Bacillota bacterium]|nr:ATP-dependent DNA helicase RecG [Bacillota bacterium]